MDDVKLYASKSDEIDSLVQTMRVCTQDRGMKFGIKKCATLILKRGKISCSEGINLGNNEIIGEVGNDGYKYLGIAEKDGICHEQVKESSRREYFKRLTSLCKSKLNSGNLLLAINTWAVPLLRYNAGIINWNKEEMEDMDRKTRKMLSRYGALHPREDVDRLYMKRKGGGRGLMSVKDCIMLEKAQLCEYTMTSEDDILKEVAVELDCQKFVSPRLKIELTNEMKGNGKRRHFMDNIFGMFKK